MKHVLVIYFSQTGQLKRVAETFVSAMMHSPDIHVTFERLAPVTPYPFPWPFIEFFDQFPEAVYLYPPPLQAFEFDETTRYDLVILAYTVWFLSPSPPVSAFLQSPQGQAVLRDTPVITLIACRNMWLQAQEQVKQLLTQARARLLDNVVLTDQGSTLKTLVTTPRWMLTGNREAFWGVFPRAGLTDEDILATQRFGKALAPALLRGDAQKNSSLLQGLKAVNVDARLIDSEKLARRSFLVWGKLFRKLGPLGHPNRKWAAMAYGLFLICMVFTVVPLTIAVRTLLKPLRKQTFAQQRQYFEEPSGSGGQRMEEFS